MTVGDVLTCTVDTLAYGGDGIARVGGQVVFIPETAPDETVRARITLVKKNFARAEAVELVSASPARIAACCRVTDPDTGKTVRVPGCVYDHLAYDAEVEAKQRQFAGFLRRLYKEHSPPLLPPFASPAPLHYRNKIVLHAQRTPRGARLGYRLEPSHLVLDIAECPLASGPINEALAAFRGTEAFRSLRDGANVTLRHTARDGAVCWVDGEGADAPLAGALTEASPAGDLRVPRDGFYQVNPPVGNALVAAVAEWFAEDRSAPELLDLYCGVGVFGFACMRAGGTRLTGIESGRAAIASAQQNSRALGIPAEFVCRALGRDALHLRDHMSDPHRTTVIVDPPREGLSPDIALALSASGARRLFYVSCDPATLTRDLGVLLKGGYQVRRTRLFDMFPRTAHFESLVELTC